MSGADSLPTSLIPTARSGGPRLTVVAVTSNPAVRELFSRVIQRDRLFLASDITEGLAFAELNPPDVAFVEIGMGDGAGLALVHHLKAVVSSVTVYALSSRDTLEAAANAVALGGAGVIMIPVAGDDVLSAIATVKAKLADRAMRVDLERTSLAYARAAGWMARIAELAGSTERAVAAEQLVEVLTEATGAVGAVVYLSSTERPNELSRIAAAPSFQQAPLFATEADILELARRERLLVVPLSIRSLKVGHVLLTQAPESNTAGPRIDGLVKLLATQATTAFALLGERERSSSAVIKDPGSSAYSFAYYVDVAGREIDRARRYGRRFAIATIGFESSDGVAGHSLAIRQAELADQLLKAARDTDILARVDEHEFHLLMPETDGLLAHAYRRRVFARLAELGTIGRGLLVGVSTFPHDGQNLSQLLRVARRRAEETRHSILHRLTPDQTGLIDLLEALVWDIEPPPVTAVTAARVLDVPFSDALALATTVISDALRGGAALIVVAHHERLCLGAAVRAALGSPREHVTLHAIDTRSALGGNDVEALAVIAEQGAYALIGRSENGMLRGIHAADPLFADLLAERLGRTVGLRLFGERG